MGKLIGAILSAVVAFAQPLEGVKSQQELDKVMAELDGALFDAFNRCELEKFSALFADDVEFYHDQTGLERGKAKLVETIRKNICGTDVRREVVPGSLEAHFMKGYGALQIGVHRFLHPKTKAQTGEARFIHLWQNKDGAWRITRVISFDHHLAKE